MKNTVCAAHMPPHSVLPIFTMKTGRTAQMRSNALRCRVRPYLSEDFYPLTAHGTQNDIWCAVQYDRPAERDGVILAYRRENAPYDRAALPMKAVDPAATYRFTDADGGSFTVDGKTLAADGLMLALPQKRLSAVLFYRAE